MSARHQHVGPGNFTTIITTVKAEPDGAIVVTEEAFAGPVTDDQRRPTYLGTRTFSLTRGGALALIADLANALED